MVSAEDHEGAYHRWQPAPTVAFTKKSELVASVASLFKNIVGAAVLSLPGGVAAFSDSPRALLPASSLALALGALSGYTFWIIGRVCILTGASTYAGVLARVYGPAWRLPIDALIVMKTATGTIVYEIIIGDLANDLGNRLGFPEQRALLLWIVTVTILLPLGLLRSFRALAPFACLGIFGTMFTAAFMALRFAQGAYSSGGEFYGDVDVEPRFDQGKTSHIAVFKFIAMLSTSYIAHFNAPKFAHELEPLTVTNFGLLCALAFGLAFLVMCVIMLFGFLTFGGACEGLILDNYAASDNLAVLARVATLASVVFGYPFVFSAFRDGMLDLLSKTGEEEEESSPLKRVILTIALMTATTLTASVVDDLGFVVALVGSLLASTICYILPAYAYLGISEAKLKSSEATQLHHVEHLGNKVVLVLGLIFALMGAGVTLNLKKAE